jgi:hypothetical protein
MRTERPNKFEEIEDVKRGEEREKMLRNCTNRDRTSTRRLRMFREEKREEKRPES